jgi:hypothetical protein
MESDWIYLPVKGSQRIPEKEKPLIKNAVP